MLKISKFGNFFANLSGGVAVADSNCVIFQRVKINDDAFWCADFVLFAIAFADVAGIVPSYESIFFFQEVIYFASLLDELGFVFEQW